MPSLEDQLREDISPVDAHRMNLVRDAWMQILKSRAGRRVAWDLLGISQFGMSPFSGNAEVTNFISGKQKVAEYIFQQIPPSTFYLMSTEAQEDNDYDRRPDDNDTGNSSTSNGSS